VNRIGQDGNGIEYNGNSAIISPKGESIYTTEGIESMKTIELSSNSLEAFRDRFPAYMDADNFEIEFEYEESDHFLGHS
jgi:predicted amidohydrolase